jgi:type IV pilus assembly protein PilB
MLLNDEAGKKKLDFLHEKEEEDLASILAQKYGIPYYDLSQMAINTDALRLLTEETARKAEAAVIEKIAKKCTLAVHSLNNPNLPAVEEDLQRRGYEIAKALVSKKSLERAWNLYRDLSFSAETKAGVLDISGEDIHELSKKLTTLEDIKKEITAVLGMKKAYRISRILEVVLAGSFSSFASDIHIEPEDSYVRLRYRLDGVLTNLLDFDQETYSLILSRVKLLSGLKLNSKAVAQDGRFSVSIDSKDIEVRTSILPGAYGESIVLRILNPDAIMVPMEELGIHPKLGVLIEKEIHKPNGMVITTGPTGSGKTTTLYAFMRKVHTPDIKIITIEDPIEYHLPGITQTQADHKKYTFALGLRSALRQDPDVIMVGEIRDQEVAETAINASLTGHLVFSTLHTNSAAGSFPRLIDLGVNPKIIGSAINIVLAQRLVRKLCTTCRVTTPLADKRKIFAERVVQGIVDRTLAPDVLPENVYEKGSCPACNGTGYKGRIGLYEGIRMTETIEELITRNPSEREIASAARSQGLLTMEEDGVLKVLAGVTAFDELDRVIDIEEDEVVIEQPVPNTSNS